ncbi:hydroxyectoine utilization dehydratase EutB [Phyllobacterium pellucidum]|uniref:hydroxyectoine utilization dehydratase EutB n=1 Tax=Phyllobacterium pellucidum TaxID=2740464 RepID=UPI001D13D365|nr:hydroxyectoine utilization dehydratase EutB [Phyllobacterium sp. T1018]UGY11476.1 hydroxyectoine utilization dehydratase EutB [Phyllobacterium sp. T1018]
MTIMTSANLPRTPDQAMLPVTPTDIEQAAARIAGRLEPTPLAHSGTLSERTHQSVYLKLETRQPIGAFKLRGAMNAILSLDDAERKRGLVTASTGNHGRAVAYAAQELGLSATICMSSRVPANKIEAIRALGAKIRIVGVSQDDAQEEVERLVRSLGLVSIPPFDHVDVVAGQGTIGLEIVKDLPDLATVLVPLSGGGLVGGIAVAVKAAKPQVQVIAISMERGAAMYAAIAAGKPVGIREEETLADSLGGGIGLTNTITFPLCRDLLDDIVLLTEAEIAAGVRHMAREEYEVVEGAGAVGVAAILAGKIKLSGPTVIIVSGGNIDPDTHRQIVEGTAA